MAFYPYRCANCSHHCIISKPMSEAATVEYCPRECSPFQPMERIYDAPPAARVHMGTPQFHSRRGSAR